MRLYRKSAGTPAYKHLAIITRKAKELGFLIIINYQAEYVIKSNKVFLYCTVLIQPFYVSIAKCQAAN